MKKVILILALLGFAHAGSAEETVTEKATVTGNKVVRTAKKAANRTAEAVCGTLTGDNKVQCLAKEAKNRMVEGKDAVVDKASEVKNKVDGK